MGKDNKLINSGYIKTLNSGAISAGNGSFIENNGTIDSSRTVTFRGNPGGIGVSENSLLINNGTVRIDGDVGTGVRLLDNSLLVNNGLVSVVGERTGGVDLNRATFVNNGVVAASGLQSVAVDGIVGSEIVNHGSLTAVGEISQGVRMGSRGTIHNFGTISAVGTNAMAIHMSSDNEVYLGQGSLLVGDIRVSGSGNTLNTASGRSQSLQIIYGTHPAELLVGDTGGLPHSSSPIVPHPSRPFTRTNQIAVLDPTNLAAEDELLADLASAVFAVRPRRFDRDNARDAASGEPRDDFSVWADGFGSYRNMEGKDAAVGSSLVLAGGALGVDRLVGESSRIGAFVGGARATIAADFDSQTTKTDTVFGGVYWDTETDGVRIDTAIAAGYSDFSWDRRVAANTSPTGLTTATGDYGGMFAAAEVEGALRLSIGGQQIEPGIVLRYAGHFLDSFATAGANDQLTIDDREIHVGVARLQLTVPFEFEEADIVKGRISLRGGVEGRTQFGDDDVSGSLLGQRIAFDPGGYSNAAAVFAGLDAEYTPARGISLFVAGEVLGERRGAGRASGIAGLRVRF